MNLTKIIKREILITSLTVIGIAITFFGLTYAIYFTIDEKDIGTVSFGQLSFDMCMDESCSTGGTTYGTTITGDVYPMNTTEGTSQTPYLFKVTNNATDVMYTKVYAAKEGASIDYTNVKLAAKVQGTSTYSYANLTQDASVLIDLQVPAGQTKIIEVYMWLDEEASNEVIGKTVTAFINAIGYIKPDDPNNLHTGDKFVANANTAILRGKTFEYSEDYQVFETPVSGYYFVEAWGPYNSGINGEFASGYIYLSKGEKLYIYTGNIGTEDETSIRYFTSTPSDSDLEQDSVQGYHQNIMKVSPGRQDPYYNSAISGYAGDVFYAAIDESGFPLIGTSENTLHHSGKYFIDGKIKYKENSGAGKVTITYAGLVEKTNAKLNNVRYIKDCIAGSTVDGWNAWSEIQAIKNGSNLALKKTISGITADSSSTGTLFKLVDGFLMPDIYVNSSSGNSYTNECAIVDLGSAQDLDEIAVWHRWNDGRTYYDNVTYVSSDNSTWTEVINQTIPESIDGKRVSAYEEVVEKVLPNEYQLVEYIQSSGTQYIDTGYYWQNEIIRITFDGTVITNSSAQSLFGNEEYTASTGTTRSFCGIPHGSNGTYAIYLGSSANTPSVTTTLGTRFNLDIRTLPSKNVVVLKSGQQVVNQTYSGTVLSRQNAYLSSSASTTVGHIFIFSNHNSSRGASNAAIQNIGAMRLYSFKLYDNGELVRDFVPCYRKANNEIGLYDLVNGVFYTNKGTGTFSKGSNV